MAMFYSLHINRKQYTEHRKKVALKAKAKAVTERQQKNVGVWQIGLPNKRWCHSDSPCSQDQQLSLFSRHGKVLTLADSTLTWAGCFLADWTSPQPNPHPSSRCPCPSPCPRPPLLTKKKQQKRTTHTRQLLTHYRKTLTKIHTKENDEKSQINKIYWWGLRAKCWVRQKLQCPHRQTLCQQLPWRQTDSLGCLFCRPHPRERWAVHHPGGCGAVVGCRWRQTKVRRLIIATCWKTLTPNYPDGVKEPLQVKRWTPTLHTSSKRIWTSHYRDSVLGLTMSTRLILPWSRPCSACLDFSSRMWFHFKSIL